MYKKGCIIYYEPGDFVGPQHNIRLIKQLYKDKTRKIHWLCKCPYCNNTFESVIGNINSGQTSSCGCLKHNLLMKDYTGQKFGKITVLEKTNHRAKNRAIMWKCKCDCGKVWEVSSEQIKRGFYSCGCVKSKGEVKIKKVLEELNISFIQQKTFDNLVGVNGGKLLFDFYLPEYNICIEYDGEQHDEDKRHGSWNHKSLTEHDNKKNEYCKNNNIRLIRISYKNFNNINSEYISNLIKRYSE